MVEVSNAQEQAFLTIESADSKGIKYIAPKQVRSRYVIMGTIFANLNNCTVYKVEGRESDGKPIDSWKTFAKKEIKRPKLWHADEYVRLKQLQGHPNIVRVHDAYITHELDNERKTIQDELALNIVFEIADGK